MEVIPQGVAKFFFKGMIKGYFGYFLLPKAILRTKKSSLLTYDVE